MVYGATVTLTSGSTDYNLLSLILSTLGYTVSDLTKIPNVQVYIDGTLPFFPNPVRELQLIGDSGNASGVISVKDANKNIMFPLAATASDLIRSQSNSIDLQSLYVNGSTSSLKLDIAVDIR